MTLQDSTFHLPRGEAGDFNPFIAKSFRMMPAEGVEPPYAAYKTAVLPLNDTGMEPAGGFKPPTCHKTRLNQS